MLFSDTIMSSKHIALCVCAALQNLRCYEGSIVD